jgi:predicted phage terminase large subunit-like protein
MIDRALLLRPVLRRDLHAFMRQVFATLEPGTAFSSNWHLEHLCWALSRVLRGEVRRLIINVPPRSGKSILASVAFPLFVLGHDPRRRLICVSHTEDLARKFSVDRRTVTQTPWYGEVFPGFRLAGRPRDLELKSTQHGTCFAAGVGGAVLGRGADLIVIDDPLKGLDALSEAARRRVAEFYDNTLVTRLNDKQTGAIVLVMQRLHQDDLVGHVLERDEWEVLSLPAIASDDTVHPLSDDPLDLYRRRNGEALHPEREPHEILEQVRRAQGSLIFQAQYQQDPVPAGGNVIRRDWLRYYTEEDLPEPFERVIASWDTASTIGEGSNYSVGTVWGAVGLDYYLLDVHRVKLQAPDLRRDIVKLSAHWKADITLIEDTELGRAMAQDLARRGSLRVLLQRPFFDKRARLEIQSVRFEAGQVHLPQEAPWLGEYVKELLAFPLGGHDDQVDSTSQALNWLTAKTPVQRPMTRRNPRRRNIRRRQASA